MSRAPSEDRNRAVLWEFASPSMRNRRPPPGSRQIHADRPRSPDSNGCPVQESVAASTHLAYHDITDAQPSTIPSVSGADPWTGEDPVHRTLPQLRFAHTDYHSQPIAWGRQEGRSRSG